MLSVWCHVFCLVIGSIIIFDLEFGHGLG